MTGVDFLMIFPLEAAESRVPMVKQKYPKLCEYVRRCQERPAYKKDSERVKKETGEDPQGTL